MLDLYSIYFHWKDIFTLSSYYSVFIFFCLKYILYFSCLSKILTLSFIHTFKLNLCSKPCVSSSNHYWLRNPHNLLSWLLLAGSLSGLVSSRSAVCCVPRCVVVSGGHQGGCSTTCRLLQAPIFILSTGSYKIDPIFGNDLKIIVYISARLACKRRYVV